MILEDIRLLRRYNLVDASDEAQRICNDIEIACDLKDQESLRWTSYTEKCL